MKPVQDLLHRIRWDPDFPASEFEIGYYDRIEKRIFRVSFSALRFPEDDHFAFELFGEEGVAFRLPFHRIREVYRRGRLIWSRPHP